VGVGLAVEIVEKVGTTRGLVGAAIFEFGHGVSFEPVGVGERWAAMSLDARWSRATALGPIVPGKMLGAPATSGAAGRIKTCIAAQAGKVGTALVLHRAGKVGTA
jgi:hypothetical protein